MLMLATMMAATVPMASLPPVDQQSLAHSAIYSAVTDIAHQYGGYYGYPDRYYRDRYRRNRVRAGDVIAGVVVIGTIAAILSSRNKDRDRDRDYRDRDYRDRDSRYRDRNRDYRSGRGLDGAIEICLEEVERDGRVETVDDARRTASGWMVSGRLANGSRFSCELGSDGRLRDVDIGSSSRAQTGGEYDSHEDDYYAQARAERGIAQPDYRRDVDVEENAPRTWDGEPDAYETAPGPDYALAQ